MRSETWSGVEEQIGSVRSWQSYYQPLQALYKKKGRIDDIHVPELLKEWLAEQKAAYGRGELTKELDKIKGSRG